MNRPLVKYLQAVAWFVLSLVVSCGNDAITKCVGIQLSPWQVAFFRCFFGTVTLLPFMLYQGRQSFKTHRPWLHAIRGALLFIAISLWSHGVREVPITTATIMSFTVPIFVLLLEPIFLRERVTWPMWIVTIVGFYGIVQVLQPGDWSFHRVSPFFVLAAGIFGLLDIINKKYATQEPMLCMLFYSTLYATILLTLPAMHAGTTPTAKTLLWLLILGMGSNLILYLLLKAFKLTSVASLAPFRYLELLISTAVGYLLFQDLPSGHVYSGAVIIICCSLCSVYYQHRNIKRIFQSER